MVCTISVLIQNIIGFIGFALIFGALIWLMFVSRRLYCEDKLRGVEFDFACVNRVINADVLMEYYCFSKKEKQKYGERLQKIIDDIYYRWNCEDYDNDSSC